MDGTREIFEMTYCRDCYRHSSEKSHAFWFSKPCSIIRHELVYAKQIGYGYWPAKVVRIVNQTYDVRFFGHNHSRAFINSNNIKPITEKPVKIKKSSSLSKALTELKKHQELLQMPAEIFSYEYEQKNGSSDCHLTIIRNSSMTSTTNSPTTITTTPILESSASSMETDLVLNEKKKSTRKVAAPNLLSFRFRRNSVRVSGKAELSKNADLKLTKNDDVSGVETPNETTQFLQINDSRTSTPIIETTNSEPLAKRRKRQSSFSHIFVATNTSEEESAESTISDYIDSKSDTQVNK